MIEEVVQMRSAAAPDQVHRSRKSSAMVMPTDAVEECVQLAQVGDPAAFEALIQTFGDPLFRFLVMKVGNRTDAKDVLQETLVAAWQGLPQLKDPGHFWAWLIGISIHKSVDILRQRRQAVTVASEATTDASFETTDIELLLQELPVSLRNILLLRYLVGLSERETARVLDINLGTVKSRTARARRRLRRSLQAAD